MPAVSARRPPRLEVGASFPRLVAQKAGGEAATAGDEQDWSRARSELILNAAGEGIYGLDTHGHCTFVNPAAARLTGHTPEELLGQSMHEVVHHSHADGGHYERQCCPIYAATRDGLVRNVSEEVFWRKDGSCFPVEYTSTPLFSGKSIVGAVVVFRDVTLRARTEAKLREALREVQALKERLQFENRHLRQAIAAARQLTPLVGGSEALQRTLGMIRRVAPSDSTVLITGETGTGKELVAQALHELSPRQAGPLIKVNCGAIPPQLAESELFGHERGAYTGASQRRRGHFEQAHGGTLFLDEVGELPAPTQATLLRVLQERELSRVGGSERVACDVRVVAATNRDLRESVAKGAFRSDLYFRLNVVPIAMPPLRDRQEDIPALARHFLGELEQKWQRPLGKLSDSSLERLMAYRFPGNVRELRNIIERASLFGEGPELDIPPELLEFASVEPQAAAAASGPVSPLSRLAQLERQHILQALTQCHWRLSGPKGAGALLGLHPNTLRYRMKKHGIKR